MGESDELNESAHLFLASVVIEVIDAGKKASNVSAVRRTHDETVSICSIVTGSFVGRERGGGG